MSPVADTISKDEFAALLAEYPALVEAISATKGTKNGQKSLAELDSYRYDEAPTLFSKNKQPMILSDVKNLVEWKLRHGKFRPTLMSLVSSNPEPFAKSTIASAITTYDNKPANAQNALDTLVKLKGIGPATASLLLNVHDPRGVIFFSDEAYYWLCCGGKKGVVKYTAKEYRELRERAADLGKRLGVGMVDVEKVAYVVMKRDGLGDDGKKVEVVKMKLNDKVDKKEGKPVRKTTKDVKPKKETAAKKEAVPKRKTDKDVEETGLRRSKRQRA